MRDFVYGKDVVVSAFKEGGYYPFACAEEVRINVKTELLAASAPGSGAWDEYRPSNRNSWQGSINGVTVLQDANDTLWFPLETFRQQVRSSGVQLRFDFTDTAGNSRYATGFAYIPESEINAIVGNNGGEFSRYTIQLTGSGPLDLQGVLPPNPNDREVKRVEWMATNDQVTFTSNKLIGLTADMLLLGSREGDDKYKFITTGLPNDRQILYNSGAGSLTFSIPCIASEFIYCLYKD